MMVGHLEMHSAFTYLTPCRELALVALNFLFAMIDMVRKLFYVYPSLIT